MESVLPSDFRKFTVYCRAEMAQLVKTSKVDLPRVARHCGAILDLEDNDITTAGDFIRLLIDQRKLRPEMFTRREGLEIAGYCRACPVRIAHSY